MLKSNVMSPEGEMVEKERRTYRRPEVKKVRLAPEEAVLATCKLTTPFVQGPGSITGDCITEMGIPCASTAS